MSSDITAMPAPAADAGKSPERLLAERTRRLEDAYALRRPDRIPIFMGASYFLAQWGGITHQRLLEDHDMRQRLLERAALHFQPDSIFGVFNDPGAALALGDRMTKWPGHGLPATGSFQFAEHEFMTADDYDAFLRDPSDWAVRSYLPRAFEKLEGLALLPPLAMAAFGTYNLLNLGVLASPPVATALQAIVAAGEEQAAADARMAESMRRLAELGFAPPPLAGALIEAPFDFMSDTLRGMRGIMLDIMRRPEQLLAAEQRVLDYQIEHAVAFAGATGLRRAFIPLHRGSDGFMSLAHFERFYWPQLKEMLLRLVAADITPVVFYEGVWNERLGYLAELPRGKTIGYFQGGDIVKIKQVLGGTMCIMGGMRNSLLQTGTVEAVRETTRKVCEVAGDGGGFVMTTGIGEMEGCRTELVEAWVRATHEFGGG
ncbi:MAG TPA: uroporphyrinogen decarboxylase family protein [Streptosporangiaceae bacterium]|nr:uroporphyrinogen decarboxylase family protein [Streptosporangiaceae bacterium]